jgi:acyl-CoA synthetase (AMP-forming)/AMP-acid ligase II
MNTAEFLQISSYSVPDRTAIVSGLARFTYMELADRVNRLATALQALGVARGSKVAIMAVNSNAYVELYYATAKLGATFVPLNYRSKHEELVYMITTAEVSVLAVSERYLGLLAEIRPQLSTLKTVIAVDTQVEGMLNYEQLIAATEPEEIFVETDDMDPTIIIYTSGTTAFPKGVVLTYLDLTTYVMNTMEPANPETSGVTLISVPIYHVAGATAIMSSIWGGRTLVVLPQFDPKTWLEAVQGEHVTHAFVVPTMLKRIMEYPDFEKYDLSSLQLIAYGAAPMPYEVVRHAVEVFDCGLMNAYGQTESTSSITYLGPEDHAIKGLTGEELERRLKRLRSVGRPMDDVAVMIMNDDNEPLDPGREGEICVAGARVMSGYFKQEEATHEAIVDGWLHTGDVGYLDEENYLFITGRKKDLIIRGGENISSGEIEAAVSSYPAIDDVAVIGVPDPDWGEVVMSVCVLKPGAQATADEVIQYCRGRLASYKAPAHVVFVDELPRNALGKVLKNELRKQYAGARAVGSGQ